MAPQAPTNNNNILATKSMQSTLKLITMATSTRLTIRIRKRDNRMQDMATMTADPCCNIKTLR